MINATPGLKVSHPEAGASPEKPENAVAAFLLSKEMVTVAGIDVSQYWEKRRVQNALRRVLEAIHEHVFGLDADMEVSDLGRAFDKMAENVGCQRWANGEDLSLTEQQFSDILEAQGIWPPEFCPKDQSEIFSSLLVPSVAAARRVRAGEPMRTQLTRRMFRDGFDMVPFNLPDFPVPTNFLSPSIARFTREQSDAVAEAVAATFATDKGGPDLIKDFFLSGLVSLEEIQAALPKLIAYRLVEDAVARIIRAAAPLFSVEEWEELVVSLRMHSAGGLQQGGGPRQREACEDHQGKETCKAFSPGAPKAKDALNPEAEKLSVSLASPQCQHRDLLATGCPADIAPQGDAEAGLPRRREAFEPVTEPLPCRELRNEDPVCFMLREAVAAPEPERVINWSTAVHTTGSSSYSPRWSDQADQGAGAPIDLAANHPQKELAALTPRLSADQSAVPGGIDYLAWVSLDLHTECGGPYLVRAFMRCCQLYGRRHFKKNGNGQ